MGQSWIGIRVSAALAILGSLFLLLASALLLWTAFGTPPDATAGLRLQAMPLIVALGVFCAALGSWLLVTAIGILRRRPWARASALILAVLAVGMGFSALVAMLFIVRRASPGVVGGLGVLAVFYGALAVMGTWWLVLFNGAGARLYFTETAEPPQPDGRPFSLTIVGGYLLLCAIASATAAILRLPAVLFGWVVTGWATAVIYTGYTAASIWLGSGVLGLQNASRIGAVVFFALNGANTAVWGLLPDLDGRMLDMENALPNWLRSFGPLPMVEHAWWFVLFGLLYALVPAWFLLRRRAAFEWTHNR